MNYRKRKKLRRIAKSHGFDHFYLYEQHIKFSCRKKIINRKAAKIFYNLMQYHGLFDSAFDVVVDNPTEFVKYYFPGILKIFDSAENRGESRCM